MHKIKYFPLISAIAALVASGFCIMAVQAESITVVGSGSTFVYPAIASWAERYKAQTGNIVNYQSLGSGAGIRQIKEKTVDFSATDKPLKKEDLNKAGLMQFPIIIGGVVPVVNVPGIQPGQLKLSGPVLADIFLGKIKRWNEQSIAVLNPQLKLPDSSISVIHRADGSGTTFLFTHYLSQISPTWKTEIGAEAAVAWKTGIGAKGNEGVSAYMQRIQGAIGYIEYAYAKRNRLAYTQLQNGSGHYIQPDETSFAAAATQAKWNPANGFYEILTNQPGQNSWPIAGATFALMYQQPVEVKKNTVVKQFFEWALMHGQKEAMQLNFVPLPVPLVTLVQQSWAVRQ